MSTAFLVPQRCPSISPFTPQATPGKPQCDRKLDHVGMHMIVTEHGIWSWHNENSPSFDKQCPFCMTPGFEEGEDCSICNYPDVDMDSADA